MEIFERKGLFITFEGIDGSGKSTQAKILYDRLLASGLDVIKTREPGGTITAEEIRNIILANGLSIDDLTEAYLFAASRSAHVNEKIIPALRQGQIIVCDRFIDSSLAYQGVMRGLGIETVYKINQLALRGILPDLTFCLTLSEEEYLRRFATKKNLDRIELELNALENFYLLKKAYIEISQMFPERFIDINADEPYEEVAKKILAITYEKGFNKAYIKK